MRGCFGGNIYKYSVYAGMEGMGGIGGAPVLLRRMYARMGGTPLSLLQLVILLSRASGPGGGSSGPVLLDTSILDPSLLSPQHSAASPHTG